MSLRFELAYLFGYAPWDRWGGKPLGRLREATDEMRTPPVQGTLFVVRHPDETDRSSESSHYSEVTA